jgi:hypothetical protein
MEITILKDIWGLGQLYADLAQLLGKRCMSRIGAIIKKMMQLYVDLPQLHANLA